MSPTPPTCLKASPLNHDGIIAVLGPQLLEPIVEALGRSADQYRIDAEILKREADRHRGEPGASSATSALDNTAAALVRRAEVDLLNANMFEVAMGVTVIRDDGDLPAPTPLPPCRVAADQEQLLIRLRSACMGAYSFVVGSPTFRAQTEEEVRVMIRGALEEAERVMCRPTTCCDVAASSPPELRLGPGGDFTKDVRLGIPGGGQ